MQEIVSRVKKDTGYLMEFTPKVERAVDGVPTNQGLTGGVGRDADSWKILAKYDQYGGYITKNGYKVKNRVFYDLKTKKPIENPKTTLLIKINNEVVEHQEGEEENLEMQLAKKQFEEKKKDKKDKKDKK